MSQDRLITKQNKNFIWVRSWNCGCLVTWFCYQLIAKPGNKTATVSWPDPYTSYIIEHTPTPSPTSRSCIFSSLTHASRLYGKHSQTPTWPYPNKSLSHCVLQSHDILHHSQGHTLQGVETSVNIARQTIMRQLQQSTSVNYYIKKIDCMDGLGTHFTNGIWAHNSNLTIIHVALICEIMIRSCHNLAHAMTAKLSWHVQICDIIGRLELYIKYFTWYFNHQIINTLWNRSPVQSYWGCFTNILHKLSRIFFQTLCTAGIVFLREFQAEILYRCRKHCFGHMCKV